MVGDPKRLSDLAAIEADVRITCRECRFEEDWCIDALTRHLLSIGGSTVWSELTRHMRCRRFGCGSRRLRAMVVPYARRQPNLGRRIGKLDEALVATAVQIIEEAVARSPGRMVATVELRLALLVVHRYARDAAAVRLLWQRAGNERRLASEGLNDPMNTIRCRLEQGGWLAPHVLIERTRAWPWQGSAPRGWIGQHEE